MVTLQWLDGGGKLQSLPAKPGAYGQPRLSPDGKLVALTVPNGSGSDIWTYDWQRDAMSKLTFGDGNFHVPRVESRRPLYRFPRGLRHLLDPRRRGGQAATADPEQDGPSGRGPSRRTASGWRSRILVRARRPLDRAG